MLELITDKYYGGIIVEEYGISLENGIPAGAEYAVSRRNSFYYRHL